MNPHEVLGLPHDATLKDAKRAFRRLAREHHPDLHPDDPQAGERFKKINAAYEAFQEGGGPRGTRRRDGPDADYQDGVWVMAEHHMSHLLTHVLPAIAAEHGLGHAFCFALAQAARDGTLPTGGASWWWRFRVRRAFRGLHLRVTDGWSGRIISFHRSGQDTLLFLSPTAIWASGARDDEVTRELVQQALAMGMSAAAPMKLKLHSIAQSPEHALELDKQRDMRRNLQWAVWGGVALFAGWAIGASLLMS